jgi:hypothetical protein
VEVFINCADGFKNCACSARLRPQGKHWCHYQIAAAMIGCRTEADRDWGRGWWEPRLPPLHDGGPPMNATKTDTTAEIGNATVKGGKPMMGKRRMEREANAPPSRA